MDRFLIIIFSILVIAALFTLLLSKIFKGARYIKYLPGILSLIAAAYNFYLSTLPSEGFQDIASFLLAIMLLTAFVGNLVTGLILDLRNRRN